MLQQHQLPDSDQYDQYGEKMLNISGVWSLSFVVVNSFGTMFAQTKSLMCELLCKINCRFLVPPLCSSHSIRWGVRRAIRRLDPTVPQLRLICCPFQHQPTIARKTPLCNHIFVKHPQCNANIYLKNTPVIKYIFGDTGCFF